MKISLLLAAFVLAMPCAFTDGQDARPAPTTIVCPGDAAVQVRLAAHELQRYLYLRTGTLLPISAQAMKDSAAIAFATDKALEGGAYRIRSDGHRLVISGASDLAQLYGAYAFIEKTGIRFYLHGDVIPDAQIAFTLPKLDETRAPLFALRGINPWGWHPFGMDAWSADDYKAVIGQLAKMKMNFIGIHCYPEGHPQAEPTVWHGVSSDFDEHGNVKHSYVSRYFNTLVGGKPWGDYLARKTSDYSFGGALLFDDEAWAPNAMRGHCPLPVTPEDCNDFFNRIGAQFNDAFTFARQLGVKTCLGTEAPLTLPKNLAQRTTDVRAVYEGTFRRIMASHPLDYYWLWTPESWRPGNSPAQYAGTVADITLAVEAAKNAHAPFQLATCGWVLGPAQNRAAYYTDLPKSVAVSAINGELGTIPVDTAFKQIVGREKWAIPWLENDVNDGLAGLQLCAGQMRRDAFDAHAYGCTGLIGLHWRTDIISPNISALAQAGWDQSWKPQSATWSMEGNVANYPDTPVAGTADPYLYRSCRYDLKTIKLKAPAGHYKVTLKFCEPYFKSADPRVFDVKLQGKTVLEKLDIFAKVGQFAAIDQTVDDVTVTDGTLIIELVARKSLPCISAVAVESPGFTGKINCGGGAYKDWQADAALPRCLPCDDFYADWAQANFGLAEAGQIFAAIDGKVPQSTSGGCPTGFLTADGHPWDAVVPQFAFVDEFEKLQPRVHGAGNLDRFDYWLNTFKYLRSLAQLRCTMAKPQAAELTRLWADAYRYLLASVNTPGALGMVVNMENHPQWGPMIAAHATQPWPKEYQGAPRLIVPCVRSVIGKDEQVDLTLIALDNHPLKTVLLYWRPLGRGVWQSRDLLHVARGVYRVTLPNNGASFEYRVQAQTAAGRKLVWPATAPELNQTVVIVGSVHDEPQ